MTFTNREVAMNLRLASISLGFITLFCSSTQSLAQFTGSGFKVAVFDSGIMSDSTIGSSKIDAEYCWSAADQKTPDSVQASVLDDSIPSTDGWFDYEIASMCRNGVETNLTGSNPTPRKTWHWNQQYDWHYFGEPHGTNVTERILEAAPNAKIVSINTTFYDASILVRLPGTTEDVECGVHGPDEAIPDSDRPTRIGSCYPRKFAISSQAVLDKIVSRGNVAAINYSAENFDSCNNHSALFKSITDAGIAIVSGSGNRGIGTSIGFPACNPYVIAVGSASASTGDIDAFTSTGGVGKIDFFADGFSTDYANGNSIVGTSYAAPTVAGAFATLRDARPTATIDQMKHALTEAAFSQNRIVIHNGQQIPLITLPVIQSAAQCLSSGQCLIGDDLEAFGAVNYTDTGQYGSAYGDTESTNYSFEIDFENLGVSTPSGKTNGGATQIQGKTISVPLVRDVALSFDGLVPGSANGFRIYVNGVNTFISTGTFLNAKSFEYTLHRDLFSAGSNTILIEPIFSSRDWGLSNINAEFKPLVELTLGVTDTNTYGSEEDPERPTSLRATFTVPNVDNDVDFAVIGSKISDATEIAAYLNGIEYGHLSVDTDVTGANDGNVFSFDKADLIEGANIIELVQREGISTANAAWSVRNMLVVQSNSSSPTIALGVTDTTQYGRNYGTNEHTFTLNLSLTPETEHDHKISWRAFDIEQSGDLEVFLNNTKIKNVNTTSNNSLGATETVTLAWGLFNPGTNTLSFRSKVEGTDNTWGVTGIKVDTSPIIDLEDENNLDTDFGYFTKYSGGVPAGWTRIWSTQDYQSRLFATFDSNGSSDETITVTGWDIDAPQEVAVYVNGVFLQYLSDANSSSVYSPIDVMTVPQAHLISGVNTLSFRYEGALSGFQDEKWGVLFGEARTANVVPIIMLLLDDEQTPP